MDKKDKARQINLVEFCMSQGISLIDQNTRNPKLAEHDSLVFFPDNIDGQWYRYSTQEGGDSISFVQYYYDIDFKKAVDMLVNARVNDIDPELLKTQERKVFRYKTVHEKEIDEKATNYLLKERKIDKDIVQLFVKTGLIKQDKNNNIIFKWIDDGKIVGANRQGTSKLKKNERSWKMIDEYSTRDRGFNLKIGTPKTVRFFESSIDLMSYMSLNKQDLKDTWYISMEGLKKGMFEHYAGLALKSLDVPPNIIYCIDSDKKGNEFAEGIIKMNSPYVTVEQPIGFKDWNDQLRLQEPPTKKKSSIVISSWQDKNKFVELPRKKETVSEERER